MSEDAAQTPTFTSADRIRQLNDIDQVWRQILDDIQSLRCQANQLLQIGCRKTHQLSRPRHPSLDKRKAQHLILRNNTRRVPRISQDTIQRSHTAILLSSIVHRCPTTPSSLCPRRSVSPGAGIDLADGRRDRHGRWCGGGRRGVWCLQSSGYQLAQ